MNKLATEIFSYVGLAVSLTAVCDMLGRFEQPFLVILDLAWGVACVAAMVITLLFSKVRSRFHSEVQTGSRLLVLRMIVALALFLLGWYVNGAMEAVYGAESAMVADNGQRLFAVIATAVFHVFYLAFTRRKPDM